MATEARTLTASGREENIMAAETQEFSITDVVSLANDEKDESKQDTSPTQTNLNSHSDETEIIIIQTSDHSEDQILETKDGFSNVAETVIIQTHDMDSPQTSSPAPSQMQQKMEKDSVKNIIDICVDSQMHENLISLKNVVRNQLNPTVISLDQNVPITTVTESPATMVTRSMSGTNSKEVYNCEECDYSSHNKHYLKQHVDLVHNDERPYKCPFCEYAGKRSHSLREHLIVHSNERPYECSHCNATFRKKGHLTNHVKLHQKTINCPLCQKSISHSDVEAHIKVVHNSEKLYVCEICSHVASDQEGIMKHLQKHKNQQIYICSSCNFMTPDFNTFLKHAESHAEADKSKETRSPETKHVDSVKAPAASLPPQNAKIMIVCSECRFVAPNSEVMKNHMWKHIDQTKAETQATQTVSNKTAEGSSKSSTTVTMATTTTTLPAVTMVTKSNQNIPTSAAAPAVSAIASNLSSEKSSYKCVECDFVCNEAYAFVVHMLSHRPELQNQSKPTKLASSTLPPKSPQEASLPKKQDINQQKSIVVTKSLESTPKKLETPSSQKQETKVSITTSPSKLTKSPNNPPFVHDVANARFHCTICGYSCEYQRTIKAHIWKHSGNKNIDYPMFQNGPLSIYDDTPISKEEVTSQNNSNIAANKTVLVEVTPKPRPSLKSPVFEKYKNVKHDANSKGKSGGGNVSTVSTVAPALAHLLAARAIAGLKQKTENVKSDQDQQKKKMEAVSPSKNEQTKDSGENFVKIGNLMKVGSHQTILTDENKHDKAGVTETALEKDFVHPGKVKSASMVTITFQSDSPSAATATVGISKDIAVTTDNIRGLDTPVIIANKPMEKNEEKDKVFVKMKTSSQSSQIQDPGKIKEQDNQTVNSGQSVPSSGETRPDVTKIVTANVAVANSDATDETNLEVVDKLESKRKRKVYSPTEDGDIQLVAKRFCTTDIENYQTSVVVETIDSISNDNGFTGMTSQQNSPRTVEVSQTEQDCSDSGVASDTNTASSSFQGSKVTGQGQMSKSKETVSLVRKVLTASDVDAEDMFSDSSTDEMETDDIRSEEFKQNKLLKNKPRQRTTSMAESAVTLLSLLKKGPNQNPACPVNIVEKTASEKHDPEQPDNSQPKSGGISSSLLAVIEQLRERSQSETDGESSSKKSMKKKIRRESVENVTQMDDVDNVEEFVEGDETKYRCKLCHYSNPNTCVIKQHMKLHKTKQPFECSLCDFMAESSESLQDHMIKHCKVRTYQCKLCSSAFNYKSQLRAHMRAHNEDVFVCDYCDFESTNPITYRNHVRAHNEKKQYKCEVCEKRFLTKYDLRSHKRGSCSKQRSFFCEECDFVAIGPQEQKSHAKIHHKEFKCGKCDYVTTSITRFQNHAKSHEEPKVLKCELCDFPAVSNRSLKSHMKRHINDQRFVQQPLEQYKCNLCGYVCHHLPSLKSHMWRHASDQNYSYEFTNEVINAAIDYDGRIDLDNTTKLDIDEFNLAIGEKLRERLESEGNVDLSGVKYAVCWVTFRCCQCGFETINKAELNIHMKSHSDVIRWTLQVPPNNSSSEHSKSKKRSDVLKETAAIG